MSTRRVLDVGQCGFDHGSLSRFLRSAFQAEVGRAEDFDEAVASLKRQPYDLVLVNRVTDSDGTRGVDLIRTLKSDPATASVPVMLVSNYPDAQEEAVGLGAIPGFGKSDIGRDKATDALKKVLS